MKGISAIVVTILLVLITISLVGFVFVFFQRSVSEAAGTTTEQQQQLQTQLGKQISIDNAAGTIVTIRHAGTGAINLTNDLSVYVNNVPVACAWGNPDVLLQPGNTATCTLASPCASDSTVKVTAPAAPAEFTCG